MPRLLMMSAASERCVTTMLTPSATISMILKSLPVWRSRQSTLTGAPPEGWRILVETTLSVSSIWVEPTTSKVWPP